ncbi:MAG TPA: LCP family protein [bacterium]|nr:LCP family protein [bacterium]
MVKSAYPLQKRKLKSGNRKWYVYVLSFLIALCIMTAGVVIYIWKVNPGVPTLVIWSKEEGRLEGITEFNLLVAGLDEVDGTKRSDTIMVMHVSLTDKFANVVSIPRDTRVMIPGYRMDKINSAYARGGVDLLVRTVEDFLGTEINFYCILRLDAVKSIIDSMGGVDLDIEKNLYYVDNAQGLFINLKKGHKHLDGEQCLQYARFRHDTMGDLGRIERQQKLLSALADKATSLEIVKHLPKLILEMVKQDLVYTNLTFKDGVILTRVYDEQLKKNINMFTVPGLPEIIDGISYVLPDEKEIPHMIKALLDGGYHPRNKLLKLTIKNGCGSPMLAQIYKQRLKYFGFDVIKTENADNFDHDRTLVIIRKKTPFSKSIAKLLNAELVSDLQPDSLSDIEVVLGRDKLENR